MLKVYFVGGPMHGEVREVDGEPRDVYHFRAESDSHKPHLRYSRPAHVNDCLELREIEALTGSNHHKQELLRIPSPNDLFLAYFRRDYRGVDDPRRLVVAYILEGFGKEEADKLVHEVIRGVVPKGYRPYPE